MQVLKKKLSLVEPTVRTDEGFEYEEGEGLNDDEVADNQAKLPVMLDQLSGQWHIPMACRRLREKINWILD